MLKLVDSRSATWLFRGVVNQWGNVTFPASRFNSEGARFRLPAGMLEVRVPPVAKDWVELRSSNGVVSRVDSGELRAIFESDEIDYWFGISSKYEGKEFLMILTRFNPPPLGLREFAAAFVRRWHHGAETRQCSARGVRRRCDQLMGVCYGTTRGLEFLGSGACLPHAGHVLGAGKRRPHLRTQNRPGNHLDVRRAGSHHHQRGLHTRQGHGRGTHAHTPRLTPVGGGR